MNRSRDSVKSDAIQEKTKINTVKEAMKKKRVKTESTHKESSTRLATFLLEFLIDRGVVAIRNDVIKGTISEVNGAKVSKISKTTLFHKNLTIVSTSTYDFHTITLDLQTSRRPPIIRGIFD